jgi:hypothetical protein
MMGVFSASIVRMICLTFAGAFAIALPATALAQSTWYVDDNAPSDPAPGDPTISDPLEDGSAAHPFDAIREGINVAVDGDEVVILDGTYTGSGNRDLDFAGRAITVRSASGDPSTCIIDCQGTGDDPHRGFYFHSGETAASIVQGLTITGGYVNRDSPGESFGGGIYCASSHPSLIDCAIVGNGAEYGAGLYLEQCDSILSNCTISANSAFHAGGGLYLQQSNATLDRCEFTRCTAGSSGGGAIRCAHSNPALTNCTISRNSAVTGGGGIGCSNNSVPTLDNCTITGNRAAVLGGGVSCSSNSTPILTNCIAWSCVPEAIYVASGEPVVRFSNIEGGWDGEGNIDLDPLLTPGGHLSAGSPCRDAGDPSGSYADQLERDGEPRLVGAFVDMGSDEWFDTDVDELPDWWESLHFGSPTAGDPAGDDDADGRLNLDEYRNGWGPQRTPHVLHVSLAGDNAWDGLCESWDGGTCGPKATIQAAIDACDPLEGDAVRIADGTYTGDGNRDLDFAGRSIVVGSGSGDPTSCIINCEGSETEPHRGFIFQLVETEASILQGLTVTGGYVTWDSPGGAYGGGIHCKHSSPTIRNCRINGNTSEAGGGGLLCSYSDSAITGCAVNKNFSHIDGGGVYCSRSNVTLASNTISENTGHLGGGVYGSYSSSTLINCTIIGNVADEGGGVFSSGGELELTNSVIWDCMPEAMYASVGTESVAFSNIEGGWEGEGNIDVEPLLTPDGHLTANSVCRDQGDSNGGNPYLFDIDGEPRVGGEVVDMGSDEWLDTDEDDLPDWWEEFYFGTPTAADPQGNEDNDGRVNIEEYRAGSHPLVPSRMFHVDLQGDDEWDGLCEVWDGGTCGPNASIQAAIDACHPYEGDEVVIADGTYTGPGNRDLDFRGRAIVVRSSSGDPATCIIDCEGSAEDPHRGFYFHTGETELCLLAGLTITGGYVTEDSPGEENGGGVYCFRSNPTIANCVISGNATSLFGAGGGVCCEESAPRLTNCTMKGNKAHGGGGMTCRLGAPVLANCFISENTAATGGGGVLYSESDATITDCTVKGNTVTEGGGGGILCYGGDLTLSNSTIHENAAIDGAGGGVHFQQSDGVVLNCTISTNAAHNTGGVVCSLSHVALTNCTIHNNTAFGGGGVSCLRLDVTLTNCIVWENGPVAIYTFSSTPVVTYSNVEGGSEEPWFGEGCIDQDPLLAPDGHLTAGSPCVDVGDPNGAYAGQTDRDGEARVVAEFVDMGSDEWFDSDVDGLPDWWESRYFGTPTSADPADDDDSDGRLNLDEYRNGWNPLTGPRTLYVSLAGNNAWDGLCETWDGATCGPKSTIQAAIDDCHPLEGDEVMVAAGTYSGDGNRDVDFGGRAITVRSTSGNPATCIIDCAGSADEPHRGFWFRSRESTASMLHGLTITGGYVNEDSPGGGDGGAVYCFGSDPTFSNCVFTANTAEERGTVFCSASNAMLTDCAITQNTAQLGGGVHCYSSSPDLVNCEIADNNAAYGGGLYLEYSAPILGVCTISGNAATYVGGGITSVQGDPILTNCTITANTSADDAGGMNCSASNASLTDCTFSHNAAVNGGGLVFFDSDPTLTSCAILENTSEQKGGGLYFDRSNPEFVRCTISGNAANHYGGGVYCQDSESTFTRCEISDNTATYDGGGVSSNDSIPRFADCHIVGNSGSVGGGLHCSHSDATIINCEITGNTASNRGGGVGCYYNDPVLINCRINGNTAGAGGGVYSAQGAPLLANCTIDGNAAQDGGGVECRNGSPVLVNCTVLGNSATGDGGGLHAVDNLLAAHNCIIRSCTPQSLQISGGIPSVTYSNIEGGWEGEGNIDLDPRFVQPGYWDDNDTPEIPDDDFWVDGDYRLLPGSPSIDAGSNLAVPGDVADLDGDGDVEERTPLDLAGRPRFFDDPATVDTGLADPPDYPEVVDMGAYEYPTPPWPGDVDLDGDIDLADYSVIGDCLSGAAIPPPGGCSAADLDNDGDVDIHDFAAFELIFGFTNG